MGDKRAERPSVRTQPKRKTRDPAGQYGTIIEMSKSNTGPGPIRFCDCGANWTFAEVKAYILSHQSRQCPKCKQRFQKVILVEKSLTIVELLCSIRGLMAILLHLLQYSILYYLAMLAMIEILLSHNVLDSISRSLLFALTIVFVVVSIFMMILSIINTLQELCEQPEEKIILDVKFNPT